MAFKLEPESIKEYLRRQMKYLRNDMNYPGYQEDTTFDLIRLETYKDVLEWIERMEGK